MVLDYHRHAIAAEIDAADAEDLLAADAADRLHRFCGTGGHAFWAGDVSLLDASVFDLAQVSGHRQLTGVYLLGLAQPRGCRRSVR